MKFKAVIFDLDGTLLNTLDDIALSANAVLKKYGFKEHPVDAYRYFVGEGMDVMVARAFSAEGLSEHDQAKILDLVKEEYASRWKNNTIPYRGIVKLLDYLESIHVAMAIFSNKPHQFAVETVETYLSEWDFVDVLGINDGIPKKPNPEGALKIVKKMSFKPEQVVYLGDTHTDMQTAINGGFFPAGALWGFRNAEELQDAGARFLANEPEDLKKLFGAD